MGKHKPGHTKSSDASRKATQQEQFEQRRNKRRKLAAESARKAKLVVGSDQIPLATALKALTGQNQRHDTKWFIENGCKLTKPDPMMLILIHRTQNGDPCKGCNCKHTCPAWPKVNL